MQIRVPPPPRQPHTGRLAFLLRCCCCCCCLGCCGEIKSNCVLSSPMVGSHALCQSSSSLWCTACTTNPAPLRVKSFRAQINCYFLRPSNTTTTEDALFTVNGKPSRSRTLCANCRQTPFRYQLYILTVEGHYFLCNNVVTIWQYKTYSTAAAAAAAMTRYF